MERHSILQVYTDSYCVLITDLCFHNWALWKRNVPYVTRRVQLSALISSPCINRPCIAALHDWVAQIVPGCVHVCLRFAVGVGSSGVCMFHVLILMSILVLNCEAL